MVDLLKIVDDRQKNNGDWRASVYLEQKEKDKVDVVYEAEFYRRVVGPEVHDPVHQAQVVGGAGLPAHRQEPVVLRPERRQVGAAHRARAHRRHRTRGARTSTSRGWPRSTTRPTKARRSWARTARRSCCSRARPGLDLAFPVDQALDRQGHQERAQAPGVRAVGSAAAHVVLPEVEEAATASRRTATSGTREEIRFYDEVEKANQTLVLIKAVDLKALPANLFTKAWLESKSR